MNSVQRKQAVLIYIASLIVACTVLVGCSKPGTVSGTYPVSGKVTYKGQAVSNATVTFVGKGDARSATAMSGSDGVYKIRTLESEGAIPGTYKVTVDKTENTDAMTKEVSMEEAAKTANQPLPKPIKPLPAKYSDPTQTPLSCTVKEEPNTYDIELKD